MGYVDDHLLPGERIAYRAHLHKLAFLLPGIISAAIFVGALVAFYNERYPLGIIALVAAALPALYAWIMYSSSEFAITDKRVVIKIGFVQRRTVETLLGKVEAIGVE